ncbi:ArnT family glycosyltransferase [Thermosulfurimonas dismutans]|uniref:Polymyxin resistance protein ArnT, undecaprenyl phosphate-alpha-L-Ara4N transferase n=1 Tax=Thermosulfurimonas dismutans TaxID=999894 RepID=A0A179D278_9BACT|nr:glycosyltransferase family 39 protein [Thermosulfurimonas dismutans]OAQ20160.1 Polymyxin resistance protein ArnT, undecaprenyl phosphate-alpha-L-Ara4N transferase [Thermosulfurimonas dismutans]
MVTQMKAAFRAFWAPCLMVLVLYVVPLSFPLTSIQEARRAEIVQEAVILGNWLIPSLNGEPYVVKPPFHIWITGVFAWLFGVKEAVLRISSFLSALGIGIVLYRLTLKVCSRMEIALLSVLILISAPKFFFFSHRVEIDMLLAFLYFLSFYFFWSYLSEEKSRFLYLGYFVAGLAALTKGPFIFFLFPPLAIYGLLYKDRRIWRVLFNPLGWFLLLAPVCGWYFYAYKKLSAAAFYEFIYTDIFGRISTGKRDPFWHYPGALLLAFMPWTLALLYRPGKFLREALRGQQSLIFLSFLVPITLLSFTAAKYSKYLLPFYPFFALFLARLIFSQLENRAFPIRKFMVGTSFIVLMMVAGTLVMEYHSNRLRFDSLSAARPYLSLPYPYYSYRKEPNYLLVFYHGGPIPVVREEDLKGLKPPFVLLVETIPGAEVSLPRSDLGKLAEISPFYRKKRRLLIFVFS